MPKILLLLALLLIAPPAYAQLPHARLDRITPLGGKAGSTVVLDVQGKDLDEVTSLHFDRPGFTAFLDDVERELGPLGVLVNNAGTCRSGS